MLMNAATTPDRSASRSTSPSKAPLGQADGGGHGGRGDEVGDQHRHQDGQPTVRERGSPPCRIAWYVSAPSAASKANIAALNASFTPSHARGDDEREDGADDVRRDVLLRRQEGQPEHRRHLAKGVPVGVALGRQVDDHDLGQREQGHQGQPGDARYSRSGVARNPGATIRPPWPSLPPRAARNGTATAVGVSTRDPHLGPVVISVQGAPAASQPRLLAPAPRFPVRWRAQCCTPGTWSSRVLVHCPARPPHLAVAGGQHAAQGRPA